MTRTTASRFVFVTTFFGIWGISAAAFAQLYPVYQPVTTFRPATIAPIAAGNTTVFRAVTPALATTVGPQVTYSTPPVSASGVWTTAQRPISAVSAVTLAPTPAVTYRPVTSFQPVQTQVAPITTYSPVVFNQPVVVNRPIAPVYSYSPVVAAPTVALSPAVPVAPVTALSPVAPAVQVTTPGTVRLGTGLIGQPKVYIDGQPLRNGLRFLTP